MELIQYQYEAERAGTPYVVMHVAESRGQTTYIPGKKMLLLQTGEQYGTVGGGALEARILEDGKQALASKTSQLKAYHHTPEYEEKGLGCDFHATIFFEVVYPNAFVVVCGGGHVGAEVLFHAKHLGFSTVLIDHRPKEELQKAMPYADYFYPCRDYEAGVLNAHIPGDAYYVCSASTHTQDKEALKGILQREFQYVGMLGSHRKAEAMFPKLEAEGISKEKLDQVFVPIGLDIADYSPQQVGLAIISEILMVKNKKGRK